MEKAIKCPQIAGNYCFFLKVWRGKDGKSNKMSQNSRKLLLFHENEQKKTLEKQ